MSRPAEEDQRLDVDVNSPLSDEEDENDEDDLKTIKDYIKIKKQKPETSRSKNADSSSSLDQQNDIIKFL